MSFKNSKKSSEYEIQVQKAISAFKNNEFSSIDAAADYFKVIPRTARRRLNAGLTRSTSHIMQQILTNAEESTLKR